MFVKRTLVAATLMFTAMSMAASAQSPTRLKQYKDWGAYTVVDPSRGKVCFIVSQPKDQEPKGVKRGPVFFFVSHRPQEKVFNEVNVQTGYPYRESSKATIQIGLDQFVLETRQEDAWTENAAIEAKLIASMRAGANMTVTGTSRRGTTTKDFYSLSGVTAAHNRIKQECGVR